MIFNLFKSKPSLKELIPEGFVDIHSHILPGIDDGAKDFNESVKLITEMKKIGFSKIIATPHTYPSLYDNTTYSIKTSFEKLKNKLPINSEISYASEYMLDTTLIEKAQNKELLCIKDNFVLVEMSYLSPPINLYEILYEIKVNDYEPILAHPERYLYLNHKFKEFYKLKMAGCHFQLNLFSTTGYYGKQVTKLSEKLLKFKYIDFVGSDIHKKNDLKNFESKVNIKNIKLFEEKIISNKIFS